MERYIKGLSPNVELAIVVFVAFGHFILASIASVFSHEQAQAYSDADLLDLLLYELIVFISLGLFLLKRGWDHRLLGLTPVARDIPVGIGLAVVDYFFFVLVWLILSQFYPVSQAAEGGFMFEPGLDLVTVLAVSILNPLFEEVFVCGYLITALRKRRSLTFAINVSVCIRLAYHLYQGPLGALSIIPMGLIFAYWYARTGRLWPLVIAHGILDFLGLLVFV
jgi:uncharacterized protein